MSDNLNSRIERIIGSEQKRVRKIYNKGRLVVTYKKPVLAWVRPGGDMRMYPRPFITSPSPVTEWAILEWVQGSGNSNITIGFFTELENIHKSRNTTSPDYMYHMVYKLGDYALSLLRTYGLAPAIISK